jgi:methyl-accepting chemotaxis protein
MHDVLQQSITFLKANNYEAYGNLDAQQAQDDMDASYAKWRTENNTFLQAAARENQSSFTSMQWTLA